VSDIGKLATPPPNGDGAPDGWRFTEIGSVASVRYGIGQPPEEDPNGVPVLRATNVKRGRLSREGLLRVRRGAIPESRNPFLKTGDIIVVRSGAYTGDVAMVTPEWAGSIAGYDLIVSPNEALDPEFGAFSLLSNSVKDYFRGQRDRSAQPHLNRQQLESTVIPLPPLPEQRAIAHVLRTVQRAREATEKVVAASKQLKKFVLRHLFTYGLERFDHADRVETRELETSVFPASWTTARIQDLANLKYGYCTSIPRTPPPEGVDIISTAEITNDGILDLSKLRTIEMPPHLVDRYTVNQGDLLFNWRNSQEHVGKTALVGTLRTEPTVFASFLIRMRSRKGSDNRFLHFLVRHLRDQRIFFKQSRRAVNQANFNANELGALEVAVPTDHEQREIAAIMSSLDIKGLCAGIRWTSSRDGFHELANFGTLAVCGTTN
jgi:type I restriction enzyme S subunit